MSLTWQEAREHFAQACGEAPGAKAQAWVHLTQGSREVYGRVDVPEAYEPEATVSFAEVSPGSGAYLDYVEADCDVWAIDAISHVEEGRPLEPEPSGFKGRNRFLQEAETGARPQPPTSGAPRYYVRHGTRIYLRDTPNAAGTLRISYRKQAPNLSDGDLTNHPHTPPEFDWAIVYFAAANWYAANPGANTQVNEMTLKSDYYRQQALNLVPKPKKDVQTEELKATQHRQRVRGYRMSPRSGF